MRNLLSTALLAIGLTATSSLLTAPCARAADATTKPAPGVEVKMSLLASGAVAKRHSYSPAPLKFTATAPAAMKKGPALTAPEYATLHFGNADYLAALDQPADASKDLTLYLDLNHNGDLTDDAPITLAHKVLRSTNGQTVLYDGSFTLPLAAADGAKPTPVTIKCYKFDPSDPSRAQLAHTLLYFGDYQVEGTITIAGETHAAVLVDMPTIGDFRPRAVAPTTATGHSPIMLLVFRDAAMTGHPQVLPADAPFNLGGTTYELADMTPDGSFIVRPSSRTAEPLDFGPILAVGQKIPPFKATTMDGKTVNFPADFKGKLVMLDFWATWCGPCMGEVPNLVKVYNDKHPAGFEILGITLDDKNAEKKIADVTGQQGMTWAQVYDGGGWSAKIAVQYHIESIPAGFLVDGDTGQILATENSLRGESLAPTLTAALLKKNKS